MTIALSSSGACKKGCVWRWTSCGPSAAQVCRWRAAQDALILASIIDKETSVPEERREVAAVFINRLRRGMRLQSDPTVIYGLTGGKGPLGRALTRRDWEHDSVYNTYRIYGLPPGPIGNPGRESIAAVLDPADVDFLFFVANGGGGHSFCQDPSRNTIATSRDGGGSRAARSRGRWPHRRQGRSLSIEALADALVRCGTCSHGLAPAC